MRLRLLLSGMLLALAMTADSTAQIRLDDAFPSLTFQRPVDMQPANDGSNRLFVVEQPGRIRVFANNSTVSMADVFLDISSKVRTVHNEEGLLGLAFHPRYSDSGYFYVFYTASNPRRCVVARYSVNPNDSNRADPASELILFEVKKPFGNHNGGQMQFGPDGYLYFSIGDGGDAADPFNNAQDVATPLGKIFRIDVNTRQKGRNYGIPSDNPYAGNTSRYLEEVWAYGLRNPWRFSFDRQTGWLWAADVGQDAVEEINVVVKGGNYGWKYMEGATCFEPLFQCDSMTRALGLKLPIWDYTHRHGNSITGGYVYRGTAVPGLGGHYVYADLSSGYIWALRFNQQDTSAADNRILFKLDPPLIITSFGVDQNNELYLLSFDGKIRKFAGSLPSRDSLSEPLKVAFPNLTFDNPVDMQPANDGTNRLFVVEQPGTIRVFERNQNASNAQVFLDIRGKVATSHPEMGLLGLAFHPRYSDSGYFYIYYTVDNPRRSIIARYKVDPANAGRADSTSEVILLEQEQPYGNHKGGQMQFGPDGYLYIAFGDGGNAADPHRNAQDSSTILGKMIRIDVNARSQGRMYSIPPDNPFIGNTNGYRDEIYALGLRNPWRFSFDPQTGWLWVSDVGQDKIEEINVVRRAGNYGWNVLEGSGCFFPKIRCDSMARAMGMVMPIWDYTHNLGSVVVGGHVYRGSAVPELAGRYIFTDFASTRLWALEFNTQDTSAVEAREIGPNTVNITSFAVDQNRELYMLGIDGKIYTFQSNPMSSVRKEDPARGYTMLRSHPNPTPGATLLAYDLPKRGNVELGVYDLNGRLVRRLVHQTLAGGAYTVTWDGVDDRGAVVSSGSYLCRLSVDGKTVATERIVLVR